MFPSTQHNILTAKTQRQKILCSGKKICIRSWVKFVIVRGVKQSKTFLINKKESVKISRGESVHKELFAALYLTFLPLSLSFSVALSTLSWVCPELFNRLWLHTKDDVNELAKILIGMLLSSQKWGPCFCKSVPTTSQFLHMASNMYRPWLGIATLDQFSTCLQWYISFYFAYCACANFWLQRQKWG